MKKITISLLALLLVVPIIFSGCKKDDDDPVVPSAKITASVDGTQWNGTTAQAVFSNNILAISGVSESGSLISITIYDGLNEGTYTLNNASFSVAIYQETTGGQSFSTNASSGVGGQVIITEINSTDKTISGTFSFDVQEIGGTGEKSITNGVIDKIVYTN